MSPLKKTKNLRITTKFVLWFLLIALVQLITVTYISYKSSRVALEDEVANSLMAVADNKAGRVEAYLHEREKNVTMLASMQDVVDAIEQFGSEVDKGSIGSMEYEAVDRKFRPLLEYYQKSAGYDNIFLINPYGDILFSSKVDKDIKSIYAAGSQRDSQLIKVFMKTNMSEETEISDFEHDPETGEGAVFISAPVFRGMEVLGVVVVQMGTEGVHELVQDYTGLGETGETIIVSKIKEEVVFITPGRFDSEGDPRKKIQMGSEKGLDIQRAAQGEKGCGVSIDYRGEKVSSVWKYLPSFRWGIVVKMATTEIFASANRLRNKLFLVGAVLLVMVVAMAVVIANSVSGPIKKLTEVSGTIAGGNLSARARVTSSDEIGELARSFNVMTDSLVEAKANVEAQKAELEEQHHLLEKAHKELDSFTYTASHDLRAPLRGISSFASFLEEDYKDKLDDEGKDHLKEIREGANRMNSLIEDLLALSRISRIQNPYEDTDINAIIEEVKKRIEFDIKEHNVTFVMEDKMPIIRCDRIKMTEVFLNLINNGIKFSSKNDKDDPKIEIGYRDEGVFHRFHIKDNGIGIAPEHQDQVFGIFKRLHTTKEFEGTGAGLSIVKRVIDEHGGKIWIESDIGKGADFCFTIPKNPENKVA